MKFRRKGVIALTAALCVALFASATMAATTVSTLEELKAASTLNETGTEITLNQDITVTQRIAIEDDIVLNLAGFTIDTNIVDDSAIFRVQSGAEMTINDSGGKGKIAGNQTAIDVSGNNTPGGGAINSKLIINGGTLTASSWVIVPRGKAATIELNNGTIQAEDGGYGISGNGVVDEEVDNGGTVITINGGKVIGGAGQSIEEGSNVAPAGIYHPQNGTLTVNGGKISGYMGIQMKSGTLNITGGTITANGDMPTPLPSHNGATRVGAAISLITCYAYSGNISASISGDAVIQATGTDSYAIYEEIIEDSNGSSNASKVSDITISGGTLKGVAGTFSVKNASVADVVKITGGSFGSDVSEELDIELPLTYNEETGTYDMPASEPSTPQHSGGGGGGCSAGFGALALLAVVPLLRMRKK